MPLMLNVLGGRLYLPVSFLMISKTPEGFKQLHGGDR
jgi:hypothetical protein